MNKNSPKISIVTTSFNQGEYLERTIKSIVNQHYPNLEYIVLDAGSTDASVKIIKRYEENISYWHSRADKGQGYAIWQGLKRSQGEIFGWLNSDDIYLPETLNFVGEYFDANPDCQILCGNCLKIGPDGEILKKAYSAPRQTVHSMVFWGCFCLQPAIFWRRKLFLQAGPIDFDLYATFDTEYAIRYTKLAKWNKVNRYLAGIRIHDKTKTSQFQVVARKERKTILARHGYFDVNPISRLFFRYFYRCRYEIYKLFFSFLNYNKPISVWGHDDHNADPI